METYVARGRVEVRSGAYADLLIENANLRAMLTTAAVVAARYDTLLREGDHRIKNSLQIVSSLAQTRVGGLEDLSAQHELCTVVAQILSIARIHDALQTARGADEVDLGELLRNVCGSLQAMAGDPCRIALEVNAAQILTPVALAQPIILAVNELVMNALRHASPDGRAGVIKVSALEVGGELQVTVSDDGIGLPPEYENGGGYGMNLVRMMVRQVFGELYAENCGGASFTIFAPMPEKFRPAVELQSGALA